MKRARRSASMMRAVGVNPFDGFPDEIISLVVDAVCSVSANPFYALYRQLPQISTRWHRLCGQMETLSVTDNAYWTRVVPTTPDYISVQYVCDPNMMIRILCTSMPMGWWMSQGHPTLVQFMMLCGAPVPVEQPQQLVTEMDLTMRALDRLLSPRETFQFCRMVHRHDTMPALASCCVVPFPALAAALSTLFLRLRCPDEKRTVFVPLWELRHRLTSGKSKRAVTAQSSYQSLRHNGRQLMPSPYGRVTLLTGWRDDWEDAEKWSTRTLYALPEQERAAFLARHMDSIEQLIFDPAHLYRYEKSNTATFVRHVDVYRPCQKEDGAILGAILSRVASHLIATQPECWLARALQAVQESQ